MEIENVSKIDTKAGIIEKNHEHVRKIVGSGGIVVYR
jgi:hypothetical protein